MHHTILITFLACVMVAAAVYDLKFQRIPNFITYPSMLIALCFHAVTNGWAGLGFSAVGLLLGTGLFFIPYLMGGMGAGDAKLMGAAGAVLGVKGVFIAALFTAIIGGLYAILLILKQAIHKGFIRNWAENVKTCLLTRRFFPISTHNEDRQKPKLCYGVAIALGTLTYISLETVGWRFIC